MKTTKIIVIAVVVLAATGVLALAISRAAGTLTSIETESADLSTNATVQQDTDASGDSFIQLTTEQPPTTGRYALPVANTPKDALGASVLLDAFPAYENWIGRDLNYRVTLYKYYVNVPPDSYDYTQHFQYLAGLNDVRETKDKPYLTVIQTIGMVPNDLQNGNNTCGGERCSVGNIERGLNGDWDDFYRRIGREIRDSGMGGVWPDGRPKLVIRFGHELNGTTYGWSAVDSESNYAQLWRRAHDIITGIAGDDIAWEYNLAGGKGIDSAARNAWPGNDYVDIIGMSLYDRNYGPDFSCPNCPIMPPGSRSDSLYQSHWDTLVENNVRPVIDFAVEKDVMFAVSEWAASTDYSGGDSANDGGNNPFLMQQSFDLFNTMTENGATNDDLKRLAYVAYFERGKISSATGVHRDLHKLSPGLNDQVPSTTGALEFDFGNGTIKTYYQNSNTRNGVTSEFLRLFGNVNP